MSRRKKTTVAEAATAEAASVFTAPEPPTTPMAIVFDDFYEPRVVKAGAMDIHVVRIYEIWDDTDLKLAQEDLEAIERVLPFVPEGPDRELLTDAKREIEAEIEDYVAILDSPDIADGGSASVSA